MDFEFFESLSADEAEQYRQSFLREASKGFNETASELRRDGIIPDFSVDSINTVFVWVVKKLRTIPMEPDESLPVWIRESEDYIESLFDFDDDSKTLVLRAAYYLGESFNQYSDELHWGTGNTNFAEQNMPVITGFKKEMELAPLLITENIFFRILLNEAPLSDIERAVNSWLSDC